ncbi:GTP cyclohydrolase 1 [Rickettsiales bacterium Ac37b]|nr:GTP cyclohydrolase 1 [Rickettsiales bacterium Ac37b]
MRNNTPTREEAKEAVRILIKWIGDNPDRVELLNTPARVVDSMKQMFPGYLIRPEDVFNNTMEMVEDYNDIILLRNIKFVSYCEHHILPIIGVANIAYLPDKKMVGIGKLAKIVEIFASRLQIQERMTVQIAEAIEDVLLPKGVAVTVEAAHYCMCKENNMHLLESKMYTSHMRGIFNTDQGMKDKLRDLKFYS